jgi:hypothetical protein
VWPAASSTSNACCTPDGEPSCSERSLNHTSNSTPNAWSDSRLRSSSAATARCATSSTGSVAAPASSSASVAT